MVIFQFVMLNYQRVFGNWNNVGSPSIKGPDNPTCQFLPMITKQMWKWDGKGRKEKRWCKTGWVKELWVPRLPRRMHVDVAKCHTCHTNSRGGAKQGPSAPPEPAQCRKCHAYHAECTSMSPSATPATQTATASPRGGRRRRRQPGVHNQKQEPHTKMWGINLPFGDDGSTYQNGDDLGIVSGMGFPTSYL